MQVSIELFPRINSILTCIFSTVISDGLSETDLALLRQFALKVKHGLTCDCWDDLGYVFEEDPIATLYAVRERVRFLSGFQAKRYHCCRSSCCCFTGTYENLQKCPYCGLDRLRPNGTPYKTFSYLPLIPQLSALFSSKESIAKMDYRARYFEQSPDSMADRAEPGKLKDIFDGK